MNAVQESATADRVRTKTEVSLSTNRVFRIWQCPNYPGRPSRRNSRQKENETHRSLAGEFSVQAGKGRRGVIDLQIL